MNIIWMLADAATTGPAASGEQTGLGKILSGQFIPIALGLIVLYFFVIRSKGKQDKDRKSMLANLKKGDTIQTIGGILGKVVQADAEEVLVKVDESSNTKIRFSRSAIHRVVDEPSSQP